MDIQKAFTFQIEDEKWTNKVLVGAVISAVPILGMAASGYGLDVIKNVIEDESRPLPTWDDLGNQFVRGLMYTIGVLVYFLPLFIVACLFAVVGGGLGAALGDSQSAQDSLGALLSGAGLLFGCLGLLYTLAVLVILPAATVRFALSNKLGDMFKFSALLDDVRRNVSGYLTVILVVIVAGIALGAVTSLITGALFFIPICGWLVGWLISAGASFYFQLAASHLWGQFYRDARAAGAVAL